MGRACFKGRTCAMRLMSRYDPKSLYALIITLIRYDHVFFQFSKPIFQFSLNTHLSVLLLRMIPGEEIRCVFEDN